MDTLIHGLGMLTFGMLCGSFLYVSYHMAILLYYSIHFHVIAIRGMRMSGRSPKWRYLPRAIFKEAFDMTGSAISIRGDGYYWDLDHSRDGKKIHWEIWDDRANVPYVDSPVTSEDSDSENIND